jgi:hypothetical protein
VRFADPRAVVGAVASWRKLERAFAIAEAFRLARFSGRDESPLPSLPALRLLRLDARPRVVALAPPLPAWFAAEESGSAAQLAARAAQLAELLARPLGQVCVAPTARPFAACLPRASPAGERALIAGRASSRGARCAETWRTPRRARWRRRATSPRRCCGAPACCPTARCS